MTCKRIKEFSRNKLGNPFFGGGKMSLGLYDKFTLSKTDGTPIAEEAEYFVLRLDNDNDAVRAVMSWAVLTGRGKLFDDLVDKYIAGDTDE